MIELTDKLKEFLQEHFPGKDMYNMSLSELIQFKADVLGARQEYFLLEMAMKTLGNAAYGSSANQYFYFYNCSLAADITGECRNLTKTMWHKLEEFFHETIWERKDLWSEFGFALDESKHDWYRSTPVSIYSDTDSVYTTYGNFFKCWTTDTANTIKSDKQKTEWILNFNKKFLDKQNTRWCEEIYNTRHGKNIHEFELETISKSLIGLKKKKYLKAYTFVKGRYYEVPKVAGTGIEIIKSTTPKLCRKILKDLMQSLMFEYEESHKDSYILYFNEKLSKFREEFYNAPIEDISQSVGVGDYKKYILEDEDNLKFAPKAPVSVKAVARFNYLAHKNAEDNKKFYSGKIKYYNICLSGAGTKHAVTDYFGFPAGELPDWAPNIDKLTQWKKTIIDPINRFLEVMNIPLANAGNSYQLSLF